MRELGDRENQNILNLEMNEMVSNLSEILQKRIILLEALNFPSPRFFSFINPAFLNFPDRSVEML
jgi:hypothetical protein